MKGKSLLAKDRFHWANQATLMQDDARRKHALGFLSKGLEKKPPTKEEFTAYGQACLLWVDGMFAAILNRDATLFAAAIPKAAPRVPPSATEFLRRDHVRLFERYFYFLDAKKDHGLIVMDEVDQTDDRRFVRRLENYFTRTEAGRYRSQWIVPVPFFVSSEMAYPVQAADVCIFCVNWGFRMPNIGMVAETRPEIARRFGPWLNRIQFKGEGYRDGAVFKSFGIFFVEEPYIAVKEGEKERQEITPSSPPESRL